MDRQRKPKAQHLGTMVAYAHGKQPGAAGWPNSGQINIPISTPYRKCYVERVSVQAEVVEVAAGGGTTVQLQKKPIGAAVVSLTDGTTLVNTGNLVAQTVVPLVFPQATTPTFAGNDIARTILEGEYLFLVVNTNSNVTTQPQGFIVTVELIVLE